jgi:hypothetical protein
LNAKIREVNIIPFLVLLILLTLGADNAQGSVKSALWNFCRKTYSGVASYDPGDLSLLVALTNSYDQTIQIPSLTNLPAAPADARVASQPHFRIRFGDRNAVHTFSSVLGNFAARIGHPNPEHLSESLENSEKREFTRTALMYILEEACPGYNEPMAKELRDCLAEHSVKGKMNRVYPQTYADLVTIVSALPGPVSAKTSLMTKLQNVWRGAAGKPRTLKMRRTLLLGTSDKVRISISEHFTFNYQLDAGTGKVVIQDSRFAGFPSFEVFPSDYLPRVNEALKSAAQTVYQ